MAKAAADNDIRRGLRWRIIGWSTAATLLLLPLGAMQFTDEVTWTAADFLFMGVLFGSVGLTFEFIVRRSRSIAYRCGAVAALLAAFLTIWVNAAVGMIGSEDNPVNLIFGLVLLIALAGAIVARLRPAGMARAMAATAIAQGLAGAVNWALDPRGALFSITFALLWLASAAWFHSAARERD